MLKNVATSAVIKMERRMRVVKKRLMVAPLTGKIYLTAVKPIGEKHFQAVGQKEEYTDEAIRAVFEWFMHHAEETGHYDISFGNGWTLSMDREESK